MVNVLFIAGKSSELKQRGSQVFDLHVPGNIGFTDKISIIKGARGESAVLFNVQGRLDPTGEIHSTRGNNEALSSH